MLSLPTRAVLAKEFGITKVGPTHVVNNTIESDGYKIEDVERALNMDAIQAYLQSEETDMNILWDNMVAQAEGRELPNYMTESSDVTPTVLPPKESIEEPLKPNCAFCATKGTRHLKTCTKPK